MVNQPATLLPVRRWTHGTCPVCLTGRTFHTECLYAALCWRTVGRYDIQPNPDAVRRITPTCYLCGTAPTTDAEHVHPRSAKGPDLWSNMAGACHPCNHSKAAMVNGLTEQQRRRAAQHQAAYLAAHHRCTQQTIRDGLDYHEITADDPMLDDLREQGVDLSRFFPDTPPG